MVAEVRLERTSLAYETKLEPPPVYSAVKLHQKWSRQMESNHLPIGYRPIARPESFAGVEPGVRVELTYPVLQNRRIAAHAYPAHTHLEPEPGIEPGSAAYHAAALPLSYTGWSRSADSNCGLGVTSAPFFPLNYSDWSGRGESNPVSWTGDPALNQ